jgi:hypothetical protein
MTDRTNPVTSDPPTVKVAFRRRCCAKRQRLATFASIVSNVCMLTKKRAAKRFRDSQQELISIKAAAACLFQVSCFDQTASRNTVRLEACVQWHRDPCPSRRRGILRSADKERPRRGGIAPRPSEFELPCTGGQWTNTIDQIANAEIVPGRRTVLQPRSAVVSSWGATLLNQAPCLLLPCESPLDGPPSGPFGRVFVGLKVNALRVRVGPS